MLLVWDLISSVVVFKLSLVINLGMFFLLVIECSVCLFIIFIVVIGVLESVVMVWLVCLILVNISSVEVLCVCLIMV